MKQNIWEKEVVVIAEMEELDAADWISPLPLIFTARWNHYLGFY